jgi:hypothetical protein
MVADSFVAFLDGVQVGFDASNTPISVANDYVVYNNTGSPKPGTTAVTMDVGYNGLTRALQTAAPLDTNLSTHTPKFVVADAWDSGYDSGVFLTTLSGQPDTLAAPTTLINVPTMRFSAAAQTVLNEAGTATVSVKRSGNTVSAATVSYTTADGTAAEDSDLVLRFGRGRKHRYIDSDGGRVRLRLKGPGNIELVRREDGEGDVLTVVGGTAATLFGRVEITGFGGDGTTTLVDVMGLDEGTDVLSPGQFVVGAG